MAGVFCDSFWQEKIKMTQQRLYLVIQKQQMERTTVGVIQMIIKVDIYNNFHLFALRQKRFLPT